MDAERKQELKDALNESIDSTLANFGLTEDEIGWINNFVLIGLDWQEFERTDDLLHRLDELLP